MIFQTVNKIKYNSDLGGVTNYKEMIDASISFKTNVYYLSLNTNN